MDVVYDFGCGCRYIEAVNGICGESEASVGQLVQTTGVAFGLTVMGRREEPSQCCKVDVKCRGCAVEIANEHSCAVGVYEEAFEAWELLYVHGLGMVVLFVKKGRRDVELFDVEVEAAARHMNVRVDGRSAVYVFTLSGLTWIYGFTRSPRTAHRALYRSVLFFVSFIPVCHFERDGLCMRWNMLAWYPLKCVCGVKGCELSAVCEAALFGIGVFLGCISGTGREV